MRRETDVHDDRGEEPLLSIVVPSYSIERLNDIRLLLNSIKEQTYRKTEVLIVVEQSRELHDAVKNYAEADRVPMVSVLLNRTERGASASRNLGVRHAHGEYVAIVDDDVVLFPDWAEQMVRTYEDETIVGVTGPALPLWEDETTAWLPNELAWLWGGTQWNDWGEDTKDTMNVGGMNCSFRRNEFTRVGGYSTALKTLQEGGWLDPTGEEVEFSLRIKNLTGLRVVFNPKVKVYHKVHKTQLAGSQIAKRAFRMGYLRHMAKRLYPNESRAHASRTESALAKRILRCLLPEILKNALVQPLLAWKKLNVTVLAIFFTSLGYLAYAVKPFRLERS